MTNSENLSAVGTLIRQYQRQLGLNQVELAKQVLLKDDSFLSRICTGDQKAQREDLLKLIQFFQQKGVLHFIEEANDLLKAAGHPELSKDVPFEAELLKVLQVRVTSERKDLILGLASLTLAAILLVFAIALVAVTPFIPDEFFVSIGSLVSGVYGATELKKYATGKSSSTTIDKPE